MTRISLCIALVALAISGSLALPVQSQDQDLQASQEVQLVKRMYRYDSSVQADLHDDTCACINCFVKKNDISVFTGHYSEPPIENPALQALCIPFMAANDCAVEGINMYYINEYNKALQEDYKNWLEMKNIDPRDVKVILKNETGPSSSRRQRALEAPQQERPMKMENDNAGTRRRRPSNHQIESVLHGASSLEARSTIR